MKKILLILGLGLASLTASAQGEFSVGADVVSSYVFRGVGFGTGAHVQPGVSYAVGGFEVGAWGSYGISDQFKEADLYLSYGFDFGLSLGLTDYYYPGSSFFEFEDDISSHAIEFNLGYEIAGVSFGANYGVNNSASNAGLEDGVMYFELGYGFENFDVFVGGGDGWHVASGEKGEFQIVNVGIGTEKEIQFTEKFSLPLFGQVIVNPNSEQFHIVAGISF